MNRVRKFNGKYQVLTSLSFINTSFSYEQMMNNWLDPSYNNFDIKEFNYYEEAIEEAYKYADLDWTKLVINHKEIYNKLCDIVRKINKKMEIAVDTKYYLLSPEELKNVFFNRIMVSRNDFSLANQMNYIINIDIANPFTSKLMAFVEVLKNNRDLRITKEFYSNSVIYLIGITDIGTPYRIRLIPSLIENFLHQISKLDMNNTINMDAVIKPATDQHVKNIFGKIAKLQKMIDENTI